MKTEQFQDRMGGDAFVTVGTGEFFKELCSGEREKWGRARGESMVERFL